MIFGKDNGMCDVGRLTLLAYLTIKIMLLSVMKYEVVQLIVWWKFMND